MSPIENNRLDVLMELLSDFGPEKFREALEVLYNHSMLIERSEVLEARPYERTPSRKGYSNGFKPKKFQTSVGKLKLQIPQVRGDIDFYPSSLERGTRIEVSLKLALAEMVVKGVSTRKVKAITEQLCGMSISSTQVSRISKDLDEVFEEFRERELTDPYEYVYLDATYEKIRHGGRVIDMAILISIGVNKRTGQREILGVDAELSEAEVHWRNFLEKLHRRGLHGVKLIISDAHKGLQAARMATFSTIPWQRCQFHFQQNAQKYAPQKYMKREIARSIRYILDSLDKEDARKKTKEIIAFYSTKAPAFSDWLEENIEDVFAVFNFPVEHRKRIRTTNGVERINEEIKRRTKVARLFPNAESCLRLVTAVLIDIHETWITGIKYLTFEAEKENKRIEKKPFYRKTVA